MPAMTAQGACDDLRGQPINFQVDWQAEIKPIINELISIDGRCTSCHSEGAPAGGLNLTDSPIDAIYTIHASGLAFPGDPLGSRLFDKLNCDPPATGGQVMPAAGGRLTLPQQALFYDWIEQGALGEPKDPIFRDFMFRDGVESLRWY